MLFRKGEYMSQIQKTKSYEIFKKLDGNRGIEKGHVRRLKEAVEKENCLHLHPIVVNKKMEIIDGQHRLEVAKQLGLDIFYINGENVSDVHLIDSNVNQKTWEVANYINYFSIREKNPVYIELEKMLTTTNLFPKSLLTLLLGSIGNATLEFLKTGKFRLPVNFSAEKIIQEYLDFIAYITDKRITPISMFRTANFTKAFRWLHNTTGFNVQTFFVKLDLRWFDLKPQRTAAEWYKLLLCIYNFKNQNRLDNEFSAE